MKQIIEIEVPEGKKAIWKDDKIIFEDIVPKLPESWEEFCKNYPIEDEEFFIDENSIIIPTKAKHRNYNIDQNILSSFVDAEAHLAYIQLHRLRDCYRQGWKPNWNNLEFKYCIYCIRNDYKICQSIANNHFLSFQSMELAEKFLKNFKDLIKQARDLI